MLEIASQMIMCLILAALIGALIGYILGKATCKDENCQDHTVPSVHADSANEDNHHTDVVSSDTKEANTKETSTAGVAPTLLSAPRNGEKDNLTRIKGIGLKIDQTLNDIGIYHFDQIANWNDEEIAWVDTNIAFPGRVKRENWVEQAKLLASGEETEFSKRVDDGKVPNSKQ